MKIDKLLLLLTIFFIGFTNITVVYALEKKPTIIHSYKKDVTGDHEVEDIELIKKGASTKLTISNNEGRLKSVPLGNTSKTNIVFQDVTQDGIKDIFVTYSTNNKKKEQSILLVFENQQIKSIPLPETVDITAQYENNYQASIKINDLNQTNTLSLSHRKNQLEQKGVYHHGSLNEPMELIVSPINTVHLTRLKDLSFGIKGRQLVEEGYGGEKLAYVDSSWKRVNGNWVLQKAKIKKYFK
ncbi:hypothetical protein [Bacillus marasmi]|uniref:hypothetical protein n=1 Tax=Bacillus marasmi TaxID=1926279 RepID=UPI0011CAD7CE|nr:hypothetical protein [Bacillus marasmi]